MLFSLWWWGDFDFFSETIFTQASSFQGVPHRAAMPAVGKDAQLLDIEGELFDVATDCVGKP